MSSQWATRRRNLASLTWEKSARVGMGCSAGRTRWERADSGAGTMIRYASYTRGYRTPHGSSDHMVPSDAHRHRARTVPAPVTAERLHAARSEEPTSELQSLM